MGSALIFAAVLSLAIPLIAVLISAVRTAFTGVIEINGINVVIDILEVVDASLPFSFVTVMGIISAIVAIIGTFLVSRKIANLIMSVLGSNMIK